jgi:hypothetical protein
MLIRGSGIVAFVLLAASTLWGLLVTTKALGPRAKAKAVTFFHEALGIATVLAIGVHMVALSIDEYVDFTWADILIPGRATWRPIAVALGVVAFYGSTILSLSFYLKKLIGQKVWRAIHFGAFGTFLAALLHGILSGSDSSTVLMTGIYVGSGVAIVLLILIRAGQTGVPTTPAKRPAAGAASPAGRQRQDDHGTAQPPAGSDLHISSGPLGNTADDVEAKAGRGPVRTAALQNPNVGKPRTGVLHRDEQVVVMGDGHHRELGAVRSVGEDVSQKSIEHGRSVVGTHRHLDWAPRELDVDRPILLFGEGLPKGEPVGQRPNKVDRGGSPIRGSAPGLINDETDGPL